MKKFILFGVLICLLPSYLFSQDEITDAFFDLQVKGSFSDTHSEMKIPASKADIQKLIQEKPRENFFCFTEDRDNDIRLLETLPAKWMKRTPIERVTFKGKSAPGEYYPWQIGVYTPYIDLKNITIEFSDFKTSGGKVISHKDIRCVNMGGIDPNGNPFKKSVALGKDSVQAMWILMNIPKDALGLYKGTATVRADNTSPITINAEVNVTGDFIENGGTNEAWRKARLNWLDSRVGIDNSVTKPYIPLNINKNTITYLGGYIELSSKTGLPKQIVTKYNQSNQLTTNISNAVLGDEMRLIIETQTGFEELKGGSLKILERNEATIVWQVKQKSKNFDITTEGTFGFDGVATYKIYVTAHNNTNIKDIRLEIPYTEYASKYLMGLGHKGGYRPSETINWNWDIKRHQDKIWMGNINAGLNLTFKGSNYKRPLVNIYYDLGKLKMPDSWGNEGKGGIQIIEDKSKDIVEIKAFSGDRVVTKGEILQYNFDMTITPLKPIDIAMMASDRLYHSNSDVSAPYISMAEKSGANIINVHHKKDIYPYINYPYHDMSINDFKHFVNEAHSKNIKVKPYYTTRELTVKTPELWALRSLNSEIIHDGPGKDARTMIHKSGPNPWLIENMQSHFIPAWYCAFKEGKYKGDMDISVITTPDSRWNNYFLEGLDWMVKNIGIDGIYIDDSALDHRTMQRARRILDKDGKHRIIDIHTWNHMNQFAGYANSLSLYVDLLPYVDRLWIGEGFEIDNTPDFWLVEMSGLPFGLMSETLNARNTYRGMIYGMLPRLPWSGNPISMWKLWDEFGMKDATILGFWNDECPSKTDNENFRSTVYRKGDKALIVVANWSDAIQSGTIQIDENLLGFKPSKVSLPQVEGLQWGKTYFSDRDGIDNKPLSLEQPFKIGAQEGLFILLEK